MGPSENGAYQSHRHFSGIIWWYIFNSWGTLLSFLGIIDGVKIYFRAQSSMLAVTWPYLMIAEQNIPFLYLSFGSPEIFFADWATTWQRIIPQVATSTFKHRTARMSWMYGLKMFKFPYKSTNQIFFGPPVMWMLVLKPINSTFKFVISSMPSQRSPSSVCQLCYRSIMFKFLQDGAPKWCECWFINPMNTSSLYLP